MRMLTRIRLELDFRGRLGMPAYRIASAPVNPLRSHQLQVCHSVDQAETPTPRQGCMMPLAPCLSVVSPAFQAPRHAYKTTSSAADRCSRSQLAPAGSMMGGGHASSGSGQVQEFVSHPADFCKAIAGRYDCSLLANVSSTRFYC